MAGAHSQSGAGGAHRTLRTETRGMKGMNGLFASGLGPGTSQAARQHHERLVKRTEGES